MKTPPLQVWMLALCLVEVVAGVSPAAAQTAESGKWEIVLHGGGTAEGIGRVRPGSSAARLLIDEATHDSPTLRALIERIERSDVVVYVQMTGSPHIPTASTIFAAAAPGARYLRVFINAGSPPSSLPQLLAHELQHVLEIASEAEVTSDDGVRNLYRRIGRSSGNSKFETTAAKEVAEIVGREMARARDAEPRQVRSLANKEP